MSRSAPGTQGRGAGRALARRWYRWVLGVTALILIATAILVAVVDPFQQYHLATRYGPRFYSLHHRYINPGLAKHKVYDTIATGSSIVENTRDEWVERYCGGKAVNLAMPAISAFEQGLLLRTALDSRPVKRVLLTLDFNAFSGAVDEHQAIAGPLPRYLFDRNLLNDLPYLASWDVALKAIRILRHDASEKFTTDATAPWYWGNLVSFGRATAVRNLDPDDLNKVYRQPPRTLAGMQASFEANLLPLLRDHQETEFDLVWPPYSILVWADFVRRGQLEVSLDFKRLVTRETAALANVRVFDFQPLVEITHDLDLYFDLYHYSPAVNERIVRSVCAGENRVLPGELEPLLDRLAQQAKAADPRAIVEQARSGRAP